MDATQAGQAPVTRALLAQRLRRRDGAWDARATGSRSPWIPTPRSRVGAPTTIAGLIAQSEQRAVPARESVPLSDRRGGGRLSRIQECCELDQPRQSAVGTVCSATLQGRSGGRRRVGSRPSPNRSRTGPRSTTQVEDRAKPVGHRSLRRHRPSGAESSPAGGRPRDLSAPLGTAAMRRASGSVRGVVSSCAARSATGRSPTRLTAA
jgi:hypothetical protein